MTPTTITARPAAGTTRPSWTAYLDALEAAAHDVATELAEGGSPRMPELPRPEGPPPPHTAGRRDQVLRLLAEVTTAVESQRLDLGTRLANLSGRSRPGTGYRTEGAGGWLDVTG